MNFADVKLKININKWIIHFEEYNILINLYSIWDEPAAKATYTVWNELCTAVADINHLIDGGFNNDKFDKLCVTYWM